MKQGMSVTGLNTAATLWSTAAVGALAGAAAYREAITGAVIIIAANGFLHPLAIRMDRTRFSTGRENPPAWVDSHLSGVRPTTVLGIDAPVTPVRRPAR